MRVRRFECASIAPGCTYVIKPGMANNYFQFKQFIIYQDRTAMKVGTDSVLLGAIAHPGESKRILDIGTGTGILALMMAQKSGAIIHAIEIDEDSFAQAVENFSRSVWNERIKPFHCSLQFFTRKDCGKYDFIITNPPWFTNGILPPEARRSRARHNNSLTAGDLLEGVNKLLETTGRFTLILPFTQVPGFIKEALQYHLYCMEKWHIHPVEGKAANRMILFFGRIPGNYEQHAITIRKKDGKGYTEAFRKMTGAFYLGA